MYQTQFFTVYNPKQSFKIEQEISKKRKTTAGVGRKTNVLQESNSYYNKKNIIKNLN